MLEYAMDNNAENQFENSDKYFELGILALSKGNTVKAMFYLKKAAKLSNSASKFRLEKLCDRNGQEFKSWIKFLANTENCDSNKKDRETKNK